MIRQLCVALTAFATILFTGCGGSNVPHQPDQAEQIAEAVSHVADAASRQESLAALFAAGAAPAESERPRYSKYSFRAAPPKIAGDTATTTVDIVSPFTDKSLGQAEWTCVREGEKWRLKTAPLPADLPIPSMTH